MQQVPFGLKPALACFQSVMTKILAPLIGKCVYVYLDILELFFHQLWSNTVTVSKWRSKCTFCVSELTYLGHYGHLARGGGQVCKPQTGDQFVLCFWLLMILQLIVYSFCAINVFEIVVQICA